MTGYRDPHAVAELAGKILIVSIIVLSVIVAFLSFFHFYSKWSRNRREQLQLQSQSQSQLQTPATHRHRRHQEPSSGVTVLRRGLNPSFLKTIPITPFNPKNFNQGFEFECAVCLSEVCEGEKTRFLPKCNHGFHVECIDMWFYSHSTCPICRNHVSVENEISVENLLEIPQSQEESIVDLQYFPTNVLFWGNETEVSTLTSQFEEANSELASSSSSSTSLQTGLVIDIPSENEIDIDIEGQKSPVSSRMRSFRRILSGSRRFMNPFSPASVNLEQGTRGQL